MFIKTVKKGDVLATGILEQGDKTTIVGADGAVYADYWVEYSFKSSKNNRFPVTGRRKGGLFFSVALEKSGVS